MTEQQTRPPQSRQRFDCQECGMNVAASEYHPFWFCVLHKAGQNPRTVLKAEHERWARHGGRR